MRRLLSWCYRLLQFYCFLGKKEEMTIEEAYDILRNAKTPNSYPKFEQEVHFAPEYDLMIIVPVYQAEQYLKQCIESILNQKTRFSYRTVFVNDGSTDGTKAVLDSYSDRVSVINKTNGGVASARNCALRNIIGKYIMFVDADDYLPENAVEKLMQTAIELDADIVEGGYDTLYQNKTNPGARHGHGVVETTKLYGYPWGKVIRANYFINLAFPEGYEFEDSIMATLLYPACKRKVTISDVVYIYRINEVGISITVPQSVKSIDTVWMTLYPMEEQRMRGFACSETEITRLLKRIRLNWTRMQMLPDRINRAAWVLTCNLMEQYGENRYCNNEPSIKRLVLAIKFRSYYAFITLMKYLWIVQE